MPELQRSIESTTLEIVKDRAEPRHEAGDVGLPGRMQSLGAVLERLWRFYGAMHTGKPLRDGDQVLPQMAAALKSTVRPGGSV